MPKEEAVSVLTEFLSSPQIRPTGHGLAVLKAFKHAGAGFMDRLIRMDLLDDAPEIKTFDWDFAKLDNAVLNFRLRSNDRGGTCGP